MRVDRNHLSCRLVNVYFHKGQKQCRGGTVERVCCCYAFERMASCLQDCRCVGWNASGFVLYPRLAHRDGTQWSELSSTTTWIPSLCGTSSADTLACCGKLLFGQRLVQNQHALPATGIWKFWRTICAWSIDHVLNVRIQWLQSSHREPQTFAALMLIRVITET